MSATTTTTTTTRRRVDLTLGEAKSLLSLALLSPVEIKGLGYRERWLAERRMYPDVDDAVTRYIESRPLADVGGCYLRMRRSQARDRRRDALVERAIEFIVLAGAAQSRPVDGSLLAAAQRELIGFALVKLRLGHLSYAKPWLPKRRKLNAGGGQ